MFIFNTLLNLLPLHSEEGRVREEICEIDLISKLDSSSSATIIEVVRCIFESFELLDQDELRRGRWAFVSFSASLFARSLVAAWAVPRQRFVGRSYWEDMANAEEQRLILERLESGRERCHPTSEAQPIRFVHVAWGMIRLGESFLLHHREDKKRSTQKTYVLPGGRLKPIDYAGTAALVEVLRDLSEISSRFASEMLPQTLKRELKEELELEFDRDYSFSLLHNTSPYDEVNGSSNTIALTRYRISLFEIKLTPLGEINLLLKTAAQPDQYPWFSLSDLEKGVRADGKTAYLDALKNDVGDLNVFFSKAHDSGGIRYTSLQEKYGVVFPRGIADKIKLGRTAQEKECACILSQSQLDLIIFLAWCARDFHVVTDETKILKIIGGWVQLIDENFIDIARELENILKKEKLEILQFGPNASNIIRIGIHPDLIFLSAEFFSYSYSSVSRGGGVIHLILDEIKTVFGTLRKQERSLNIPPKIADPIETIHNKRMTTSVSIIKRSGDLNTQNLAVSNEAKKIGLRQFLTIPKNLDQDEISIIVKRRF